jgi:hypothetical protein
MHWDSFEHLVGIAYFSLSVLALVLGAYFQLAFERTQMNTESHTMATRRTGTSVVTKLEAELDAVADPMLESADWFYWYNEHAYVKIEAAFRWPWSVRAVKSNNKTIDSDSKYWYLLAELKVEPARSSQYVSEGESCSISSDSVHSPGQVFRDALRLV